MYLWVLSLVSEGGLQLRIFFLLSRHRQAGPPPLTTYAMPSYDKPTCPPPTKHYLIEKKSGGVAVIRRRRRHQVARRQGRWRPREARRRRSRGKGADPGPTGQGWGGDEEDHRGCDRHARRLAKRPDRQHPQEGLFRRVVARQGQEARHLAGELRRPLERARGAAPPPPPPPVAAAAQAEL